MSPNSLANLQTVCNLNIALRNAALISDQAFLAAISEKQAYCNSRGLTNEFLVGGIADEILVTVEITKEGEKPEVFSYPAVSILAYHQDDRSWADVGNDAAHQHLQAAYAEVFAFWYEKGRFGESAEDYQVNLVN